MSRLTGQSTPRRIPARRTGTRALPDPLPLRSHGRWRKRWRYVGVYGPDLMLCAGVAQVGPLPQRFWAVAEPGRSVREATIVGGRGVEVDELGVRVRAPGVEIDVALDPRAAGEAVEVTSPHGGGEAWIWTRKRAPVPARVRARLDGRVVGGPSLAFVDESAGYHARRTAWKWSAGIGEAEGGETVAWNLVTGVHDVEPATERTVWVDGVPRECGPAEFAPDLSAIRTADGGQMAFTEWGAREDDTNAVLFRSRYRQPFGVFRGTLPGGIPLRAAYGVMEDHDVLW